MLDQRWKDAELIGYYVNQGLVQASALRQSAVEHYGAQYVNSMSAAQVKGVMYSLLSQATFAELNCAMLRSECAGVLGAGACDHVLRGVCTDDLQAERCAEERPWHVAPVP